MKKGVHLKISGKVQGVWYRGTTKQKAQELGIKGWVKNTADGCVEAVFVGEDKIVNEMISWCYKGPPLAKVKSIEIINENINQDFDDFSVKY